MAGDEAQCLLWDRKGGEIELGSLSSGFES